jgi:hypothetical protein
MTAEEYLKENSDWFDKSPGGEKLYFESEVIKMMEKYSSQTEISDKKILNETIDNSNLYTNKFTPRNAFIMGAKWYREQLKNKGNNTK